MDRIPLKAQERTVLGKKVKRLRRDGLLPGHVFGKGVEVEHVSVPLKEFIKVSAQAGETGLVDLRIGEEKIRPVLIRDLQHDPKNGVLLHVDFYQVNLSEKVEVPVPVVVIGEEPESVHLGEAVVLQPISELQVEALPTDLIENIEVDITSLKNIDDAITVADLNYDRSKITVLAEPEEVVIKLAPAVTEEMKQLMEEEAEATAAAQEAVEGEAAEGEAAAEGESEDAAGESSDTESEPSED